MRSYRGLVASLAIGLLFGVSACGDDAGQGVSGSKVDDVATNDAGTLDNDTGTVDAGTSTADTGASNADTGTTNEDATVDAGDDNCPGGAGCPCQQSNECDGGFCIDTPAGKRCAAPCTDSCPSGFACKTVKSGSGDLATICVPSFMRLCNPCKASKECESLGIADAACVDQGEQGAFCGAPCAKHADCPDGYGCAKIKTVEGGTTSQCVRNPDKTGGPPGLCACSKQAIATGAATFCSKTFKDPKTKGDVVCKGTRTCAEAGLGPCSAPAPSAEKCDSVDNDCDGTTDENACDDDNPCTEDACVPASGSDKAQCSNNKLHKVPCDADGNACTEGDICDSGACKPGKPKNCDDGNPCTTDFCDQAKGCTQTDDNGAPCDDGNPCTLGEICGGGACMAGKPKTCASPDPCVVAKCKPTDGKCVFSDAPDGLGCVDATKCTKDDVCTKGICAGKVVDCNDSNACTDDACDAKSGCTHKTNNHPCSDNNKCTANDGCATGKCVGLPIDVTTVCDDGKVCTKDTCSPAKGCVHSDNKVACTDGNPCTVGDRCDAGGCKAGNNVCACAKDGDCGGKEDGDLCNGTLFCDKTAVPFKCAVDPKTVITCSAKTGPCRKNACDGKTGKCGFANFANGLPCDADGSVCSQKDSCQGGLCKAGKLASCDDNNVCTDDSCDAKNGCVFLPTGASCTDSDPCTVADVCKDKLCLAGKQKLCNDGNTCTVDACDKKTGACVFSGKPVSGAPCDADGSVCTAKDACDGGVCKAGKLLACDDKNGCTTDSCDAKKGCQSAFNTAPCDADGDACTVGDVCKNGSCQVGAKKVCNDGEPCTADSCDGKSGKCVTKPVVGGCDDANPCTVGDKCGAKGSDYTCLPGAGTTCNDNNPCTTDSCDVKKGCVYQPNATYAEPCYPGPIGTADKGACKAGTRTCDSEGSLGACKGAVIPAPKESCDGVDNTCDGQTDEGCKAGNVRWTFAPLGVRTGPSTGGKVGMVGHAGRPLVGGSKGGKTSLTWSLWRWLGGT